LKSTRTIIPGPPGTGKTYRLINVHLEHELQQLKTESKKILYISFSNAAAEEARKRINELYPGNEIIVSTMHSFGTSMLKIDTNTQLLEGKTWNTFKNYSGICKDLNFENVQRDNGYREYKIII
jgi:superfamily I DNA/RNA helicase